MRCRLVLSTRSVSVTVQNCSRVSPGEAGMDLEHGGKGCKMDAAAGLFGLCFLLVLWIMGPCPSQVKSVRNPRPGVRT